MIILILTQEILRADKTKKLERCPSFSFYIHLCFINLPPFLRERVLIIEAPIPVAPIIGVKYFPVRASHTLL